MANVHTTCPAPDRDRTHSTARGPSDPGAPRPAPVQTDAARPRSRENLIKWRGRQKAFLLPLSPRCGPPREGSPVAGTHLRGSLHPVVFHGVNEPHSVRPPSADGHSGGFQFPAMANRTAADDFVQAFCGFTSSSRSGKFPRSAIRGSACAAFVRSYQSAFPSGGVLLHFPGDAPEAQLLRVLGRPRRCQRLIGVTGSV